MNYLNTLFGQARDLVMSMTPQARLMAILMTAVIVVSSAFLVRGTTEQAKDKLFNGYSFKDHEIHQAEIALGKAKLIDFEWNGHQLLVPAKLRDVYIKALADGKAFPKDLGSWTEDALSSGNMLEPFMMVQKRMMAAKQQSISSAIRRLPFVNYAWVEYDEQREGFARNVQRTASVFVQPNNPSPLTQLQKRAIMEMVCRAFAGLELKNVSIMDYTDGSASKGESDAASTQYDKYMQAKQQYEHDLQAKAQKLLNDFNTPTGEVIVEVEATLDRTLREASESIKYDDKPTPTQSTNSVKTVASIRNPPAGRPGFDPNAGANRSAQLAQQPESTNNVKESMDTERSVVGETTTLTDRVGFQVKHAAMSVKIPQSYYQKAWEKDWRDRQAPDKRDGTPEPMTKTQLDELVRKTKTDIEGSLVHLLPKAPAEAAGNDKISPFISVYDYVDAPLPAIPAPSVAEMGMAWFANSWQTIALVVMAFVAMMMLRSAVKAQPKTNDEEFSRGFGVSMDTALAGGELTSFGQDAEEESSAESTANPESAARRFATTGEKVREELSTIVRENPTVAVNILRSWISDAA